MKKKVLDVGQCAPDHAGIKKLVHSLGAEIRMSSHPDEAIEILQQFSFDLVLVNRKIDMDYSDGIELIHKMKRDEKTRDIPVMLITNHANYQKEAMEAGGVEGFGKDFLYDDETKQKLLKYLA